MKETVLKCDRCGEPASGLELVAVREARGRLRPFELCGSCVAVLVAWLDANKPAPAPRLPPATMGPAPGPPAAGVPPVAEPLGTFARVGQPSPGPQPASSAAPALPRPLAPFQGPGTRRQEDPALEPDELDQGDEDEPPSVEGDELEPGEPPTRP